MKKETICWHCENATNGNKCPWANGIPRKDWEAARRDIYYYDYDIDRMRHEESYIVLKCPGFKEG